MRWIFKVRTAKNNPCAEKTWTGGKQSALIQSIRGENADNAAENWENREQIRELEKERKDLKKQGLRLAAPILLQRKREDKVEENRSASR